MEWFHVSIIGNVVLLVILGYMALDRRTWNKRLDGFKDTCLLRHNPIDKAIKETKEDIRRIWDLLQEKL